MLKIKEDTLNKRATEIDDLEKKNIDHERQLESLEAKKQGMER